VLAGDDLRERAHMGAVERSHRQQLGPGVNLVQVFDDRERLGQQATAVLERGDEALGVDRLVALFEVLALGQAHARLLVRQALVVERDANAERGGGAEEGVELHFVRIAESVCRSSIRNGVPRVNAVPSSFLPRADAAPAAALFRWWSSAGCP